MGTSSQGIGAGRKTQLNCGGLADEPAGEMSSQTHSHERIRIRLEDEGRAAWLTVAAGPVLGREAVDEALAGAGIVAGIDGEAVVRVAEALTVDAEVPEDYCVARGRAVVDATPDVLELVEPIGPIAGRLRQDESFDFCERRLIIPVETGETIGRIVPGSPGEPGFDVLGHAIAPRPAAALKLALGDGITRDASGSLLAARQGARSVGKNGALDIVALYVHAASVDLRSGNLETEGSLQIARDVTNGMSVRAGVDLAVKGTVEAADVEAGGSIEIGGGVIGVDKGRVRAGGDLKLRHALSARLFAGGTLEVTRSVSTSDLHAREITVGGTLLGNQAVAESRIRVLDAGSPAGGPCLLRVAHPLAIPGSEKKDQDDARDRARALLRNGPDRLSARKSRDTRKGRGERPSVVSAPKLAPQLEFRKRQRELQPSARIEIRGTAHAGCKIDFGSRPLVLEQSVRATVFRLDMERDEIVAEEM